MRWTSINLILEYREVGKDLGMSDPLTMANLKRNLPLNGMIHKRMTQVYLGTYRAEPPQPPKCSSVLGHRRVIESSLVTRFSDVRSR